MSPYPHITYPKNNPVRCRAGYHLPILQMGKWRCKGVKRLVRDYTWREGVKPET